MPGSYVSGWLTVSGYSLSHSGVGASGCNWVPGAASGVGWWGPRSAMEAMSRSGRPQNSGGRGPMWPAPLASGGLALGEVTCGGWGPHLQYSFFVKLASPLSHPPTFACDTYNNTPVIGTGRQPSHLKPPVHMRQTGLLFPFLIVLVSQLPGLAPK